MGCVAKILGTYVVVTQLRLTFTPRFIEERTKLINNPVLKKKRSKIADYERMAGGAEHSNIACTRKVDEWPDLRSD